MSGYRPSASRRQPKRGCSAKDAKNGSSPLARNNSSPANHAERSQPADIDDVMSYARLGQR